jgi:acetyltransferase-like isoleucine patch superfamily enzyme
MIRQALSLAVNTVRLRRDPVRYFRSRGVEIGEGVEIFGANLFTFGSEPYLVSIGNQVTISHNVDFVTHDGGLRIARDKYPNAYLYGRIQVADRCFLGAHCILLTGEIPSGVVAIGVPAKPVKSVEEYIQEKRHLWIDTRGLTLDAKRELLRRRLAK